ncbi:MAG: hypothetical protein HQK55_07975 [Deltaproteobacteria bacterium]|nr:hypothetical protein [Deltaproteobacteria bacterium]
MEIIAWISTVFGLVGTLMSAAGRPSWMKYVQLSWLISNPGLVLYNLDKGQMHQASMFGGYTIISLIGVMKWRKQ